MQAENTNSLVIDASAVLAFLMPDESSDKVDKFFQQFKNGDVEFISSFLLPFEVINGIKMAFLRKRISLEDSKQRIEEFLDYQIQPLPLDLIKVFDLAVEKDLTVYDAAYLYLAKSEKLELLTLDDKLKSANSMVDNS